MINENTHDRVSELLERVGLSKRMDHIDLIEKDEPNDSSREFIKDI